MDASQDQTDIVSFSALDNGEIELEGGSERTSKVGPEPKKKAASKPSKKGKKSKASSRKSK